ncbi:MAG: DUF4349 domain-containing protein [Clostridia bacterium]|nr:DUF4349 domain-containing protein [Clostridia bacterium]NCC45047.1 DUF4349 domain-containing protein [Clostridia bacterium]
MKRRLHTGLALCLAGILLLGGCGGSASKDSYQSASTEMATVDTAAVNDTMVEDGGGWSAEESVEEDANMETRAATAEGEPGVVADEDGTSANDLAARKLIKTVSLSMETKEFDTMKQEMEKSISSFGGYIEYSNFDAPQGGNSYRYYSITVRVPSDKLDGFVESAGKLGTVTNKSESVEDVTLNYVDMTAHKESLQVEYDRVTKLLEQAEDLDQILALESKLSDLRYEIDSYESQLRTYDNLIDYSTVNIYISEVEYEKETADTIGSRIKNGFSSSLYSVRDFFVNLFVFLVSNLPVLLLLAVIVGVLVYGYKKTAKKRKEKREQRLAARRASAAQASASQMTSPIPTAPATGERKMTEKEAEKEQKDD